MTSRFVILGLASLWILLLVTAAGLSRNTWFLHAVGGIGILQNVFVAGTQRTPENFGVPLEYMTVLGTYKVMETLLQVETQYKDLGRSMREILFPGKLRDGEEAKRDALDAMWAAESAKEKDVAAQK